MKQDEKELRVLIDSLKNVLTDVPYYIEGDDDEGVDDWADEIYED